MILILAILMGDESKQFVEFIKKMSAVGLQKFKLIPQFSDFRGALCSKHCTDLAFSKFVSRL